MTLVSVPATNTTFLKEKLIIKNFGPIKSVELELGRFNVLIGENATGKSTVAKVLAVCRYFSYLIKDENSNLSNFSSGLEAWGMNEYYNDKSAFIYYECDDYHVEVRWEQYLGNPDFHPTLKSRSKRFEDLMAKFEDIRSIQKSEDRIENSLTFGIGIPSSFYENDVKAIMDNPFYFQPERGLQSIFSIGKSSINNLSDSLFNQLAEISHISQRFVSETHIEPLDVYYRNVRGQGFIRKANSDSYYSVFNAASGYKSTIPVVLVLKFYIDHEERQRTFIVEEPELNLFPIAQNKLMQYLVNMTINYGGKMVLTTHSPYTLTSLNNMMYAWQIGQLNNETEHIVARKYWLNPDDVSAYMMMPDGTCEDIVDREQGMIKADKIDSVSNFLGEQFDQLVNLELSSK